MKLENGPNVSLGVAAKEDSCESALLAGVGPSGLQQSYLPDVKDFASLSSLPNYFADRFNPWVLPLWVALGKSQSGRSQGDSPGPCFGSAWPLLEPDPPMQARIGPQVGARQQVAHPADNPPQGKKSFLAETLETVPEAAMPTPNPGSKPDSEKDWKPLRVMVIGPRQPVIQTIHTLFLLGFAEMSEWSPLIPGPNPGEVMSILTRSVPIE